MTSLLTFTLFFMSCHAWAANAKLDLNSLSEIFGKSLSVSTSNAEYPKISSSLKRFEPLLPELSKLNPPLTADLIAPLYGATGLTSTMKTLTKIWLDSDTQAVLSQSTRLRENMKSDRLLDLIFTGNDSVETAQKSCNQKAFDSHLEGLSDADLEVASNAAAWVILKEDQDQEVRIEALKRILSESRFKKDRSKWAALILMNQLAADRSRDLEKINQVIQKNIEIMNAAGWETDEIPAKAVKLVSRFPECLSTITRVRHFMKLETIHLTRKYGSFLFKHLKSALLNHSEQDPNEILSERCSRMDEDKQKKYCRDRWGTNWLMKKTGNKIEMKSFGADKIESSDDLLIGTLDLSPPAFKK
jgi:hypothetical protein